MVGVGGVGEGFESLSHCFVFNAEGKFARGEELGARGALTRTMIDQ